MGNNSITACKAESPAPAALDGKTRLLLAAETLFAEGGIDGASLREIAIKAGQGNHYAVQYHFGSRDGLVRAIFDHRMQQMEAQRGRMLEAAHARGTLQDARTLFEIVFLPQLTLQDANGNHSYANFLSQYLLRNRSTRFGDFGSPSPPHLSRTLRLLRRRLHYLPQPVAQRRLVTACFMFLNILVIHGVNQTPRADNEDFQQILDDTLDQIVLATCMSLRHAS